MKVAEVAAIENMKMDKVPNIVQEIILQNLSGKLITLAKFGLVQIINSWIWSFEHSHQSNPNVVSDKYIQMHCANFKIDFFLLYRFKLVLKVIYLTLLHTCYKDSQSMITEPKHRINIWDTLWQFISIFPFQDSDFLHYKNSLCDLGFV